MELVEGEDLSQRVCERADPDRRGAVDRPADRRGARSRARTRDHSSRSQTRQHQTAPGRHREGARLRAGQGDGRYPGGVEPDALADVEHDGHPGGRHPRDRGLHVTRAGQRLPGRSAERRLFVRQRAVRDVDRPPAIQGRHRSRRARLGPRHASPTWTCCRRI